MGAIIAFPGKHRHARTSSESRAASFASKSAVIPLFLARSVLSKRCHHSAGMLFRVLHFGTVQRPTSSSEARSSGEGHKSMTSRNVEGVGIEGTRSFMAPILGQSVLNCKYKSSLDGKNLLGHTVQMSDSEEKTQYDYEFIERVKAARIATGKKQWQVAELMGVKQDEYKHWETQRVMPHHRIGRFCLIVNVDPNWLFTGKGAKPMSPLHAVEAKPGTVPKPKRTRRSKVA